MTTTVRRVLSGLSISLTMTLLATAQQPMPRTTKQSIAGASTVKTEHLRGTVIAVEGNHLAVRMATVRSAASTCRRSGGSLSTARN